ncbi:MAG: rhamnulokinase [Oscillospiraceae bacterium]|nr:rhamnulokinase [Oscillospiraceae bacterium]
MNHRVLAVDLGASSGRAMLVSCTGNAIEMQEIHRFVNQPLEIGGAGAAAPHTLFWDLDLLIGEIKRALVIARDRDLLPDSLAIDTWGVDFGLIGADGKVIQNPVHYRDARTAGMMEECFARLPAERLYALTGVQFMELNTVFQLAAAAKYRPELLEQAQTLLLMPDLLTYLLTGQAAAEFSIAGTTQLLDPVTKDWCGEIFDALSLPKRLMPPVVMPGTPAGVLRREICEELGLPPIPVVRTASHDTKAAAAAVPAVTDDFLFISLGTWAIMGTELAEPVISDAVKNENLTNEGGAGGVSLMMKTMTGCWLLQESRRQWRREGNELSFPEIEKLAAEAPPFRSLIDPDHPRFAPPGDLPGEIRAYCAETGQPVPQTVGETARCIYESLALSFRKSKEQIERCTGKTFPAIHIIGGGSQNPLICEMTAAACGIPVYAGPVEATVLGNAAVQWIAADAVKDIAAARKLIAEAFPIKKVTPMAVGSWPLITDH